MIGLVGLMLVGMAEVSSCGILPEIRPGRRVEKGEELGYFQFGGSTYCLIFRPGAVAGFAVEALPQAEESGASIVLVGRRIATADGSPGGKDRTGPNRLAGTGGTSDA